MSDDNLPPDELPDIRIGDTVRKPRGTIVWSVTRVERYERHAIAWLRSAGRRSEAAPAQNLVVLERDPASVREVPPWADACLFMAMDRIAADGISSADPIDVDPIDVITAQGWSVRYLSDIRGMVFIVASERLIVADPANSRDELAKRITHLIERHPRGE